MTELGIYPNLSNEDYHNDPAISRSGVMRFLDCPYRYWTEYLSENKREKEDTPAIKFGKAFHKWILEFETFYNEFVFEPKRVYLTEGKDVYQEYKNKLAKLEFSGKIILLQNDHFILREMATALNEHNQAWSLIQGGWNEASFFWKDEHSGLMVKARPDILHENMIIDLKTVASASSRAFQNSMIEYGNHIQGAMIQDGIKQLMGKEIKTVINICIEKTYPYCIGIKIIGEDALEYGRQKYKQALLDIKNCIEKNEWMSYDIETINLPKWIRYDR